MKPVEKRPSIEEREAACWGAEVDLAIRIVDWVDLLLKLHRASDTVPADLLIEQLRRANRAMLASDRIQLMTFLKDRFMAERNNFAKSRQQAEKARKSTGKRGQIELKAKALAEYRANGGALDTFAKRFAATNPQVPWQTVKKWIQRSGT